MTSRETKSSFAGAGSCGVSVLWRPMLFKHPAKSRYVTKSHVDELFRDFLTGEFNFSVWSI